MNLKSPPSSIEIEKGILGSIIIDNKVMDILVNILLPEFFYLDTHRLIYRTMLELYENKKPIDVVTISEKLGRDNMLEEVGGVFYLTSLIEQPVPANVEYYAEVLKDKWKLRKLLSATSTIAGWIYEEEEADKVLDRSEQLIFEISSTAPTSYFTPAQDIIDKTWKMVEERSKNVRECTGIPTGFRKIDKLLSGLQNGDLIIIAGRPSMGKTAFALDIAMHIALVEKIPVAFFSLEMSQEQLGLRMLSMQSAIDQQRIRIGDLQENEWMRLTQSCKKLYDMPLYIDETSFLTPIEIRSRTRRLKTEKNVGIVFIDYLQLLSSGKKTENKVQEIAEISRALKGLAKELKIPVVALSQLSREIERRKEKSPFLSDLRESGAIEQDADVVMFVHRRGIYELQMKEERKIKVTDEERERLLSETKCIIAKQRNGPIGTVDMYFFYKWGKFEVLESNIE